MGKKKKDKKPETALPDYEYKPDQDMPPGSLKWDGPVDASIINMASLYPPRPHKVRVGYQTYYIIWVHESEWLTGPLDNDRCGQLEANTAVIQMRLVPQVTRAVLREVLLHEILHAVAYHQNLRDVNLTGEFEEVEERLVASLAFGMTTVLADPENKEVVTWLTSRTE